MLKVFFHLDLCLYNLLQVELGDKIVWRKQENGAVCCTKGANFSSKVLQQIIGSYKDNRIVPRVRTEEQKHDKNVTYQVQNEESLKVMLLNAKDGILALIKCNTTCTMRTLCLYCYLFRSCDLCIIIIHKHCGRDIVSCIKPCRYISIYYRLSDAIIQQGKWESSTAEVRIQGGLCQKFCSQVRIQRGLCQKFCAQVRIQRGLCQKFCDMNSLFFYVFTTSHLPNLVNNKSYNLVYIKFLKLLEKNNVNRPFCFIGFIPITLRTAKRLWSYGCSECYRDRCHFKLKLRKSFISSSYDANHLVEQRLSATGELDENESASPVISNSYEAYYHVQRRILSATGELGESTSPGTAGDLGSLVESKMYERSPYDDQKVFNYTVYFKLMDYLKRKR